MYICNVLEVYKMSIKGSNTIKNYFSLVKFAHTVFALPFAFVGYFLGMRAMDNSFQLKIFLLILLCMLFARNSAMGFNRYIDKDFDKKNIRTANRVIPQGLISPTSALIFVIINSILFIITTFFINKLVFFLSPVALFIILSYSFTKRFTYFSHLVLGLSLSLAPIGAYLAFTGKFALLPLLFSFIVLFWVAGFDIIYALQDEEFDKSYNLKSIPVKFGRKNAVLLSIIFHSVSTLLVLYIGFFHNFGFYYWLGAIIFIGLLIYQHFFVKTNDLSKINIAFFTTNGIASIIFATFVIVDCLMGDI